MAILVSWGAEWVVRDVRNHPGLRCAQTPASRLRFGSPGYAQRMAMRVWSSVGGVLAVKAATCARMRVMHSVAFLAPQSKRRLSRRSRPKRSRGIAFDG